VVPPAGHQCRALPLHRHPVRDRVRLLRCLRRPLQQHRRWCRPSRGPTSRRLSRRATQDRWRRQARRTC